MPVGNRCLDALPPPTVSAQLVLALIAVIPSLCSCGRLITVAYCLCAAVAGGCRSYLLPPLARCEFLYAKISAQVLVELVLVCEEELGRAMLRDLGVFCDPRNEALFGVRTCVEKAHSCVLFLLGDRLFPTVQQFVELLAVFDVQHHAQA